jgi:Rieske Fe-S protein
MKTMKTVAITSRRKFLKAFALGAVASSLGDTEWSRALVGEVRAGPAVDGSLRLKLSDYPALQSANGSVRVSINPFTEGAFLSNGLYPILVNRGAGNQFFALNSRCTHSACVVGKFNNAVAFCACHSSLFNIDGARLGGPAPTGLATYAVSFDGNDSLTVTVPELGYSIAPSTVQANGRMRLDFPTRQNVNYEVVFAETLVAVGAPVSFAATLAGSANLSTLAGTGGTGSVFIDRTTTTGFYTVNIIVNAD